MTSQATLVISSIVFLAYLVTCALGKYGPLPAQPYHIVWQSPSRLCQTEPSIHLSFQETLKSAGILMNHDDEWEGEYSTIMYLSHYGKWPHYLHEDGTKPINGGLPQNGNMTAHLIKCREKLDSAIPSTDFYGLGIINQEQFRPLWARNWGSKNVYRTKSLELVRATYKDINPTDYWIQKEAIKQFEYDARKFMSESLRIARELRPHGLFGYYNFPYCFNYDPTLHCDKIVQDLNTQMTWLWEASTGIYPSVYMYEKKGWDTRESAMFMYGNIEEAVRVAKLGGGRPVYAYSRLNYDTMLPYFYPKIDMLNSLRLGADFAIDGMLLWGAQKHYKTKLQCHITHDFLKTVVGPFVNDLLTFTQDCSKQKCSGNGRCRHRGTLEKKFAEEVLRTTMEQLTDWRIDERYSCECYKGFTGNSCGVAGAAGRMQNVNWLTASVLCIVLYFTL